MTTDDQFNGMPRSADKTHWPLRKLVWVAVIFAVLLAISYLIAIPVGLVHPAERLSVQEIILASAILIALAFAAQTGYALNDLTLGPSGLSAHFNRIETRQNKLEADVRALQVALTGLVTKFELMHLQSLAAAGPAIVRYGEIFVRELTHLDAMGFVRPIDKRGINAIGEDHGSGLDDFNLKQYLEITQEGREYLDLRDKLTHPTGSAQQSQ
jgi:hypothetical protein